MLIEKMGLSESIKLYDSETFLIIAIDDIPKVIKDYQFVETKRQQGVYAYEEWLKNIIETSLES